MLISLFSLLLQGFKPLVPAASPFDNSPGGDTTVHLRQPSFVEPANNLSRLRQQAFYIGRSFFRDPWVIAPSATQDRDGLGPLFNARSCSSCHPRGGRGQTPANSTTPMLSLFLRLSLPGKDQKKGVVPEPTYGDQLQVRGISVKNNFGLARKNGIFEGDGIIGEAHAYIEYSALPGHFADGENWVLRKPTYKIRAAAWGDIHPHTLVSPRLAPSLAGLGLLEAIDEKDILALADPDDKNNDGISGRANQVWDIAQGKTVLGRFGLKANQPNLLQQTAAALRNDIGITNHLFKRQPCTTRQTLCQQARSGASPGDDVEITPALLDAITFFGRMLAVNKRRDWNKPIVLAGRTLFYQAKCHACHTPHFVTSEFAIEPELAKQTISPYSDLLLHDMGKALADGRPDFLATGNEWRTAPLWGIGLQQQISGKAFYLHDGRARTISEAILWHGGEAEDSKTRFTAMNKKQRQALLAFVKSL